MFDIKELQSDEEALAHLAHEDEYPADYEDEVALNKQKIDEANFRNSRKAQLIRQFKARGYTNAEIKMLVKSQLRKENRDNGNT